MEEISVLIQQRDELLAKICEIEESCEGIDNENNIKRIQELNYENEKLISQKNELIQTISSIEERLLEISNEIVSLSGTGTERILEAIKKQRWYFFKNKTKVLFDRDTGLLWNNPAKVDFIKEDKSGYSVGEAISKCENFDGEGFLDWKIVTKIQFEKIANSNSRYPYYTGPYKQINNLGTVNIDWNNNEDNSGITIRWIDRDYGQMSSGGGIFLIFTRALVNGSEYEQNVSQDNPNYTEKERLQFTLDLFIQNELFPIFEDEEITELYKKIYFEKPRLLEKLNEIQSKIEEMQSVTFLSSDFDYSALLSKYDTNEIDSSVIKYYQAVQKWCYELLDIIDSYEKEMSLVIKEFNRMTLKLSNKYIKNAALSKKENSMLKDRKKALKNRISLGKNSIQAKILAVKKQADDLEYRIAKINEGENSIYELSELEQEKRVSFAFLAENTSKIIKDELLKIEYFMANSTFVEKVVDIWDKWSKEYIIFKTEFLDNMKNYCEQESIEESIRTIWCDEWQRLRYSIELMLYPALEYGLKSDVQTYDDHELTVVERIINALHDYKDRIDKFYLEERGELHKEFENQMNGFVGEKLKSEVILYKYQLEFHSVLKDIVFDCINIEDKIWIMNWVNSIFAFHIDEILSFVSEMDDKVLTSNLSNDIVLLKNRDYELFLEDEELFSNELKKQEDDYMNLCNRLYKQLTE